MNISVCILADEPRAACDRETEAALAETISNTIKGLRRSPRPPREVIVAAPMGNRLPLPEASFPVRLVKLAEGDASPMRARNAVARDARGDLLVFLDPSCIPSPAMLDDYAAAAQRRRGVIAGEVGFLPQGATATGVDFAHFQKVALAHPERPDPAGGTVMQGGDASGFWGLNFAVKATDLKVIGGFDEKYGEAEFGLADFARRAEARGLAPQWIAGAKAFHQFRALAMPPVERLDAILADAGRFQTRWGVPAGESWLRAFTLMGLATPDAARGEGHWRKLRDPRETDLALARQPDGQVWPGSERLLELLEDRTVLRLDAKGRSGSAAA